MPLPLNIFEPRYRQLVADLTDGRPADGERAFGVIAIREGWEVGPEVSSLHEVGCTAAVQQIEHYPTAGTR